MGCAGSKSSGPVYETEESRKDAAANALQLAATAHLRKKAGNAEPSKADKAKVEEDSAAKALREAEAASLLQRAATAHLALAEPVKPPGLNIPTQESGPAIIANVIESARGVATAISTIFGGGEQQPAGAASGVGARPPSIAIPAPGTADTATQSGDNLFTQALNSARGLFGGGPAEPTVSAAEELAAKLEAEEAAAQAEAAPPSPSAPSPTAATAPPPAAASAASETATAETSAGPVLEQNPPAAPAPPAQPKPEPEPAVPSLAEASHPDAFRPSLPTPEPSPKAPPPPPAAPATPSKPAAAATPAAEVRQEL